MAYFRCTVGSSGGGATLTVTYDGATFDGVTLTATNGNKTLTRVATSSGTTNFSLPEGGTWTVSATVNGYTYSESVDVVLAYSIEFKPTIYGFHIDGAEASPTAAISYQVQYDGENVKNYDYTPASMNYSTNQIDPGSWNLTDDFFIPRSCMVLYDGTVDYYLDEDNEAYKEDGVTSSDVANTSYGGNAMMEWGRNGKKIWMKIVPDDGDDESATVYIADEQVDNDFYAYPFYDCDGNEIEHFYTAKYNGVNVSSKLRSISGQSILYNVVASTEVTYATANNTGADVEWYTEVLADRLLINMLLFMIGRNLNTQAQFGNGHYTGGSSASSLLATGTMNGKGQFYGTNGTGKGVKVFGMENWWGNQWRRTAGYLNVSGTQKIKLTYNTNDGSSQVGYDLTGSGYITINGATPSGTSGGYTSKAKFTSKGMFPYYAAGSNSTYYCDGLWYNNGQTSYAVFGGLCAGDLLVGASCLALQSAASSSGWIIGAALSLKPLASV